MRAHGEPIRLTYDHAHASMGRFAKFLALRYERARTRHAYYRQLRLLAEHCGRDPATITEEALRDYFLHVKTIKGWNPKTIRQAAACARLFFVELLGHDAWTVFSQVRAKDLDFPPGGPHARGDRAAAHPHSFAALPPHQLN